MAEFPLTRFTVMHFQHLMPFFYPDTPLPKRALRRSVSPRRPGEPPLEGARPTSSLPLTLIREEECNKMFASLLKVSWVVKPGRLLHLAVGQRRHAWILCRGAWGS